MRGMAPGTSTLFHLRLQDVAPPGHEPVSHESLHLLEAQVVPVVVVFNHLKAPPARQHIAADQLTTYLLAELLYCITQLQVSVADQPMKRIQVAARFLDRLKRLRHFAGRVHGGIGDAVGSASGSGRIIGAAGRRVLGVSAHDRLLSRVIATFEPPDCSPD
jgi:hypothetical protein